MNNREIKFRAFSKIQNRMFLVYGLGQTWVTEDTLDGVNPGTNCFSEGDFLNDIVIMQYTGLKDKNNIEIYEGDILQREYSNYEVLFKDGCWLLTSVVDYYKEQFYLLHLFDFSKTEVVGNIYDSKKASAENKAND